ncbi:Hypothetical protein POVN_LOCUS237 [uncultured virus]|nr:Hypothetical protein POVN_LOCUS237 [uncultured virus]
MLPLPGAAPGFAAPARPAVGTPGVPFGFGFGLPALPPAAAKPSVPVRPASPKKALWVPTYTLPPASLGDVSSYPRNWEYIFEWKEAPQNVRRVQQLAQGRGMLARGGLSEDDYNVVRIEDILRAKPGVDPQPYYLDIAGDLVHTYNTGAWVKKAGDPYGRGGFLLDVGQLKIARQAYDPIVRFRLLAATEGKAVPTVAAFNKGQLCLPKYDIDIITLTDLDDYKAMPRELYTDEKKRCYVIESMLEYWESAFSSYDLEASRVVPVYPTDVDGASMEPQVLRDILVTAHNRGFDVSKYPLLNILLRKGTVCDDLYEFITKYQQLITAFDVIHAKHPEDEGVWNRRDIIARAWFKVIYQRNGLQDNGYRKYSDILSQSGSDGSQAFPSCILSALFYQSGYRVTLSGYEPRENIIMGKDAAGEEVELSRSSTMIPMDLRWGYAPKDESALIPRKGRMDDLVPASRACIDAPVILPYGS